MRVKPLPRGATWLAPLPPPLIFAVTCHMSVSPGSKSAVRSFLLNKSCEAMKRGKRASTRSFGLCASCRGLCTFTFVFRIHGGHPLVPHTLLSLSFCLSLKPQSRQLWGLHGLCVKSWAHPPGRVRGSYHGPCPDDSRPVRLSHHVSSRCVTGGHGDVPPLSRAGGPVVPARGRCGKTPRTGRLRPRRFSLPGLGAGRPRPRCRHVRRPRRAHVLLRGRPPSPRALAQLWCPFPSRSHPRDLTGP